MDDNDLSAVNSTTSQSTGSGGSVRFRISAATSGPSVFEPCRGWAPSIVPSLLTPISNHPPGPLAIQAAASTSSRSLRSDAFVLRLNPTVRLSPLRAAHAPHPRPCRYLTIVMAIGHQFGASRHNL